MNKHVSRFILFFLASCAVGPDYKKPDMQIPATYKEAANWKQATPQDDAIRGKWWEIFGDAELNKLVEQVNISNQNIKTAEAQLRQARSSSDAARSAFFPSVSAGASADKSSSRSNPSKNSNSYSASLDAIWELDVWGRIRRESESSEALAQASEADLQSVRLIAQSELVRNYFQLRLVDAQKKLLDDAVANYERSLKMTQNQYKVGVAARSDVIQAQTQLDSTKTQAMDTGVARAQLEHAIAILIGKAPADFSLAASDSIPSLPDIPLSVPSKLLERRPDIAAAERRVAAANAQIGVAEAAFFPDLTLSATGGYQSSAISKLFSLPNRFWSVGPALAANLFNGGFNIAQLTGAEAAYDASVAQYRQTVLTAFQEVEDNLSALRILQEEAKTQASAVASARQALQIAQNQYKAGTISYLNVVVVQATALSNERSLIDIKNRQLASSVALIRALGGGWESGATP
jgi:NodT family efflux transporter outer membrane factor (OMF) lipoprotein